MHKRRLLHAGSAAVLAGSLFWILFAGTRASPAVRPGNVAAPVWEAVADGGQVEFLVILDEQADLGPAAALQDREARLRTIYDTLRETARRTQAPLLADLEEAGVAYRPFYIVNMLALRGGRALVLQMASRTEVARIAANPRVRQALPAPHLEEGVQSLSPQGIAWGVARVNADDVWALGFTGQDIVVAGQDTGYDWEHPALIGQYRGTNGITATHDYNWHDAIHGNDPHTAPGNPCGFDSPVPCDDNGHGTHTMGTIVGDDGGDNQIGVAPGARWIGCRNMEQGWGTPTTYAECFQFFLAPYPLGGDPFSDGIPNLAPHVINNSWVCPPDEGCDPTSLQQIVETVRAAGIVVVASAGNDGSACSTITKPIAIYDGAFSVGATDSGDAIASFSSRGPVTIDGSYRLKPDLSAPGVGVYSSFPGDGYRTMNGTSMAAPHVAGVVALLWSAAPCLVGDVDRSEWILTQAAYPRTTSQGCGGDGPGEVPNHVYGWGIVDAQAAVQRALPAPQVGKQAFFPTGWPARTLVYTLSVTNTSCLTLTHVVLTDAVPAGVTFAWAGGDHVQQGGVVTWTAESLACQATLTATLAVTVEHLLPGTLVVNGDYGVRADELAEPARGAPVEMTVPWRVILFPIFKNWVSEGPGDG